MRTLPFFLIILRRTLAFGPDILGSSGLFVRNLFVCSRRFALCVFQILDSDCLSEVVVPKSRIWRVEEMYILSPRLISSLDGIFKSRLTKKFVLSEM